VAGRKVGRGVSTQFAFGSYMAQVAEVSVGADGDVRVHRVVCAVDCGQNINPDTIVAQMEGGIVFGASAALWDEITHEKGRVQQTNFRLPRDAHERGAGGGGVYRQQPRRAGRDRRAGDGGDCAGAGECGVCGDGETGAEAADRGAAEEGLKPSFPPARE
jgi:hypothetical protein